MTSVRPAGRVTASATEQNAWVVHARDVLDERLSGHDGRTYTSPPQPRASALALVALLIGPRDSDDGNHWTVATAGGRRVVDLDPAGPSCVPVAARDPNGQ
ncbi:hypothetical protein [Solirubrobacter soli]|uniref:hypothetical protein n=1 Tax=Solirubrobacter soli TaxID=363832 RepID=UPI0003FED2C0|nr:hypothetical protein [Solirubrobacter soli]